MGKIMLVRTKNYSSALKTKLKLYYFSYLKINEFAKYIKRNVLIYMMKMKEEVGI